MNWLHYISNRVSVSVPASKVAHATALSGLHQLKDYLDDYVSGVKSVLNY